MLEEVKKMLAARKGAWKKISEDSGVDYRFIINVASGVYDDPGIKRLDQLNTYLLAN